MSDIVDRITAIQRKYRYSPLLSCCPSAEDHEAHVAERIVAELGMTAVRCADERWWSTRIERGVY